MGGLIPLGDASRPARRATAITMLIIAINVFVFFLELNGGNRFVYAWSAVPYRIMHGHRAITLLTSMFMHAGFLHIIGNMIYLWAFGPAIEQAMGSLPFYRSSIWPAAWWRCSRRWRPIRSRTSPSSAPAGPLPRSWERFIVTFPRDRIRTLLFFLIFFRVTYIPAALLIGFWFLIQLFNAGSVAEVRTGGVAYLAHIAGFLFGVILGRLLKKPQQTTYPSGAYWRD